MKKVFMMLLTFVLVFTSLLPSYTAYSEEKENYCESMAFSVQTIKVEDEVIEGKAEPESKIELEIEDYEDELIVDGEGSFTFELEELEVGNRILLTNEQHKIESEIKEVGEAIEIIESDLDGECEIKGEMMKESEESKEPAIVEEKSDESAKERTYEYDDERTEEETIEMPEENKAETKNETLDKATVEDEAPDESTEEKTDKNNGEIAEEKIDEIARENDTVESESETIDEETVEDEGPEESIKKTIEDNNAKVNEKKTDKITESAEDELETYSDFVEEELTEENNNQTSKEIVEEKTPQKLKEQKTKDNTEKESTDIKEKSIIEEDSEEIFKEEMTTDNNEKELLKDESIVTIEEDSQKYEDDFDLSTLMKLQQFQFSSIDELLSDTSLEVSLDSNSTQEVITLSYTGYGPLGLPWFNTYHAIFYIPPEILNKSEANFEVTYDIPALISFVDRRRTGSFSSDYIESNIQKGYVQAAFTKIPFLNILSSKYFTFELKITLDELPVNKDGEYFFNAITSGTLNNPITNYNGNAATLFIKPLPPVINEPVYSSSDNIILTGTGAKNSEIVFNIGEEEYRGNIGDDRKFSVEIPSQTADTVIEAFIVKGGDGEIHKSDSIEVTVLKAPDVTAPVINSVNIDGDVKSGYEVTGEGEEPGDIVVVSNSIGGDVGKGIIDKDGYFSIHIDSVDVKIGEELTVQAIDEASNESDIHTLVVPVLKIVSVPETIVFQTTEITDEEKTVKREDGNYEIKIQDTRNNGDWTLTARAQPLKNGSGYTLSDAMFYNEIPINNEAVDVVSKSGKNPDNIQTISWSEDEGVLLKLNPIEASTDSPYKTTIEWTLTDGPQD